MSMPVMLHARVPPPHSSVFYILETNLTRKHCSKCGKRFCNPHYANLHEEKCSGFITHQCAHCYFVFDNAYFLRDHRCIPVQPQVEAPNIVRAVPVQPQAASSPPPQPVSLLDFASDDAFDAVKDHILADTERLVAAYRLDGRVKLEYFVLKELAETSLFTGPQSTRNLIIFHPPNVRIVNGGRVTSISAVQAVELTLAFCKRLAADSDVVQTVRAKEETLLHHNMKRKPAAFQLEKTAVKSVMLSGTPYMGRMTVTKEVAVLRKQEEDRLAEVKAAAEARAAAEAAALLIPKPPITPQRRPTLAALSSVLQDALRAHPAPIRSVADVRHHSVASAFVSALVQYTTFQDKWYQAHDSADGELAWAECADPTAEVVLLASMVCEESHDVIRRAKRALDDEELAEADGARQLVHVYNLLESSDFKRRFSNAVGQAFGNRHTKAA